MNGVRDKNFEALLAYLKESRGFDFTGYKRTSLMRRVRRRMDQVGVGDFGDYADLLQVDADEFVALFNTILINVTTFFRDRDAWDYLGNKVVPALLAERSAEEPLRLWSAGCASGEEAYSLAILMTEALGPEEFRRRVKIYATDVDGEALTQARHAAYDPSALEELPPDLVTKYFERQGDKYLFRKDLRRSVIFGRNDLVQDAPISRIDLLVCRNTLMYFNVETQAKILDRFHFALKPQGVLFLGQAEMLLHHSKLFDPVDLRLRVFRKAAAARSVLNRLVTDQPGGDRIGDVSDLGELRDLAFASGPVAQVVVTADDVVALVNHQAEQLMGVSSREVGRLLRDLELSYRPLELRGFIDQARLERRAIRIKDVEWRHRATESKWLEVDVNPLIGSDNGLLGVSIVFHDVTATRNLLDELEQANRQLEQTYGELQSTNEELETTNEELQSTNEELETTNEELQSTNEELETMNEELQSTNEELQVINETLRGRTLKLDELNIFLESILTSVKAGVVVVDKDMHVTVWNAGAEDLWGIRRDEAEGQHLLNLDIGLPMEQVRPIVGSTLADPQYTAELQLTAVNRRGRTIELRLSCGALRKPEGSAQGAILLMESLGALNQPETGD
ncbi:CheR family methyltransferase [Prauserella muralis]|uniref:protein-glutamate O-methyltransferase n=1 Tax=Prauserella muralis TaxID=588067 RepID=A0A2V4B9J2_9PSEU|nr:CheR family methyltransferase [Prauserella muralis]PXY31721.1 chemotaxis protein CheR [Prauserella muralis]TWE13896.1 two-component system CheB/CheR fusion protein [Prauserella muralis]